MEDWALDKRLEYMIRPVLSLELLSFLEQEGKVGYRWGRDTADQETMNYLEFIARGQVNLAL